MARIKRQYERGDIPEQEYLNKRDQFKHALAEVEPPAAKVLIDAAHYLHNMAGVWKVATKAEQRDLARVMLNGVNSDSVVGRLSPWRPKPAFRLLVRQVTGLTECDGAFEIES